MSEKKIRELIDVYRVLRNTYKSKAFDYAPSVYEYARYITYKLVVEDLEELLDEREEDT